MSSYHITNACCILKTDLPNCSAYPDKAIFSPFSLNNRQAYISNFQFTEILLLLKLVQLAAKIKCM